MNQKYTDKGIRNLDTGRKVATGVSTAVGAAKAAVGLGLIAKTTAAGSVAGPVGTAVGLLAGLTATGISAISNKKKKKRAKDKQEFEERSTIATELGAERTAEKEAQLRQKPAPYGMSHDPDDPKVTDATTTASKLDTADTGTGTGAKTGADTDSLVNPEVTNAMTTASKLDTAGNLINSGVAIASLINSKNAKPVEKVHTQIAKAPKEPERIDDNTEAIRAMAQSQVQGNLGAAEKQMIEMGVNPAMVQSIKASQGNDASIGINANLAQNKHQIQAMNAQIGNQHEQFATQVGMQNAQAINQANQFNIQNQAQANQYNSQALMQSLAALGKSTSNIGKIKLDKALMYDDLEMNALQQAYYKKMMGVK